MDRRAFLAAAGAAILAPDRRALAAASLSAEAVRRSADTVKIDWGPATGPAEILVADDPAAAPGAMRHLARATAGAAEVRAPVSPRPYFLVRAADGRTTRTAERLLPLKGGRNFRDLGGYPAAAGKQVRWGRLYRSGAMSRLTAEDLAYLRALNVSVVCDLRSLEERGQEPSPFLKVPAAEVAVFDYEMGSAGLDVLAGVRTRQEAVTAFAKAYVAFTERLQPHYTDLFRRLVAGQGPLVLNCSAGKDRTGMGSALILSVLGVPREAVLTDYGLTEVYTPPAYYKAMMANGNVSASGVTPELARVLAGLPPEVLDVLMGSDPEVMRQALAAVDARYGGPVGLAKARFGLTEEGVARMRRLYLA